MSRTSSVVKDRYNKKAYDEMKIRVSKGEKDKIQSYAISNGESLNAFVNRAIDEAMQRQLSTTDTPPQKKESPPTKGKLKPSVLLAEDGKRDTGTSTGKDRPLPESDLLPWEED